MVQSKEMRMSNISEIIKAIFSCSGRFESCKVSILTQDVADFISVSCNKYFAISMVMSNM